MGTCMLIAKERLRLTIRSAVDEGDDVGFDAATVAEMRAGIELAEAATA